MNLLIIKNKLLWHPITILILIKILGVVFATLIFARYSPLIDSQLYLNSFYTGTKEFRTQLVQNLASLLNHFGGNYFAHLSFAMISVLGLIYYYVTGGKHRILLLTLLLPSNLVWTSIVGKDAIYVGGSGLVLVLWSSYAVRTLRWYEIFIVVISLSICFYFRPHYAIGLVWIFVATFLIKHLKEKALVFLILILVIGVVIVYLTVWEELLFRGYSGIDPLARASRFTEFGITPYSEPIHLGFNEFKEYLPLGILIGIIGPLPSEVLKRIEFLPFFLEGLFILLSPLLIFRWANRKKVLQLELFKMIFWWCLIPASLILMLLHAPFGILNPGSALRWRTNFEQFFYLAPLLLLYRFTDTSPK